MVEAISSQLLNVDGIGLTSYEKFLEERFCTKTVCLSDTIHRTNVKTPLLQFTSLVIQRMFLKRYQSAKMPSYNECLILLRSEESPWKNFSSLMYVLVHLCLTKKASWSAQLGVTLSVQELETGKSHKELPPSCIKTGYKVDVMVMSNVRKSRQTTWRILENMRMPDEFRVTHLKGSFQNRFCVWFLAWKVN